MLVGARLNWLLNHGKGKKWNPNVKFIQLDIDATEPDSNYPISAPVTGDISSSIAKMLNIIKNQPLQSFKDWLTEIDKVKNDNKTNLQTKLNTGSVPMNYFNALKVINEVLENHQNIYVVNEGANTLDNARNIINMYNPRLRLDSGTWGVMGIGMGYSIGAAVTGKRSVIAIVGDSAFGFSGMEIETICRYKLPITIVIFNNNGIYRGTDKNLGNDGDPSPTTLTLNARYDKMIEAFNGKAFNAGNPEELYKGITEGLNSKTPTLINCIIDPSVGTESGHIGNLNPRSNINR